MKSFDLMKLSKPTKSVLQSLNLAEEEKQPQRAESDDDHSSIFANSPIVNCEITGKKSAKTSSGSGSNSANHTPISGGQDSAGGANATNKQQTFESVMKSKGR